MLSFPTPELDTPPLERFGWPELYKAASPAAGAEFTESVSGNYVVRLVSISVRLTPDANVADRTVYVDVRDDGGVRIAISGAPVTVPASDTTDFYFSALRETSDWEVNSTVLAPLEPQLILPTWTWGIRVNGIQATDTLTRIRVVYERFFTSGNRPG